MTNLHDPLTDAELHRISGVRRPTAQARWLTRHGIKYLRRADGSLMVRPHWLDGESDTQRNARQGPRLDGLAQG